MTLQLTEETLASWMTEAIPENDLFFFNSMEEIAELLPNNVLVMPRKEFFSHQAYSTIAYINAYRYWNIAKTANYVCIIPPFLLPTLSDENKQKILTLQKQIGRGLIWSKKDIDMVHTDSSVMEVLKPYSFSLNDGEYIAFQRDMWSKLPIEFKKEILISYSNQFIDEVYEPSPEEWQNLNKHYPQILKLINRFPEKGGANCFASVLAAVTTEPSLAEWTATQWVAQETLLLGLSLKGYKETGVHLNSILPKDILLWRNKDGSIIHGAFYMGDGLVFNKNGQMCFNPWQILKLEVLLQNWGNSQISVWRK